MRTMRMRRRQTRTSTTVRMPINIRGEGKRGANMRAVSGLASGIPDRGMPLHRRSHGAKTDQKVLVSLRAAA
jgi:hypothetical protein